jgi:hypothetical protein
MRIATAPLVVLALALSVGAAGAQDTPSGIRPYRFTVEGYLSHMNFDRGGDASRAGLGGYGARVMFNRSDAAETLRTFFSRSSVGAFVTITGEQNGFSTQHFGAEGNVSLFAAPVARGVLDPFVSVGVGALRANPNVGDSKTNFALTPGIGTRLPFPGGFGFRGDLRAPIVFGDNTSIHPVAEGGVYISF